MNPEAKVRVIFIKRSARAVKGGRRFSFNALVVVGDNKNRVGLGFGKSSEVATAIHKAEHSAIRQFVHVSLKGGTIPHEACGRYCGAHVVLRPASPGTGIIASKTVRAVLECAGVKNAVSKSLGAKSEANVAKATLQALMKLHLAEHIYKNRGLKTPKPKAPIVLKFPDLNTGADPMQSN